MSGAHYSRESVSDYMDSDTEGIVGTAMLLNREKFRSRFKRLVDPKKSTRANPQMDSIVEWFPNEQVACFAVDAYRFNLTKNKWVRKGPVALCLVQAPNAKHRVLGYYLHGTMSLAFNIRGWFIVFISIQR